MPAAAFQIHPLLHQGPAARSPSTTTSWASLCTAGSPSLLVVDLDSHLPPQAFLRTSGQHTEVEPEVRLGHVQVLVALVGDEEVETILGGCVLICWRQKNRNGLISNVNVEKHDTFGSMLKIFLFMFVLSWTAHDVCSVFMERFWYRDNRSSSPTIRPPVITMIMTKIPYLGHVITEPSP